MIDKVYNLWNRNPVTVRQIIFRRAAPRIGRPRRRFPAIEGDDHAPFPQFRTRFSLAAGPALAGTIRRAISCSFPRR